MNLNRLDTARNYFRVKVAHQRLHERILQDDRLRPRLPLGIFLLYALSRTVFHSAHDNGQLDLMAELRQCRLQTFAVAGGVERVLVDLQCPLFVVPRHQLRLQSQLTNQGVDGLVFDHFAN